MKTSTKNQTTITAEPGKQELFITREFDAPVELVFKAFTTQKLLEQWLGPREYKTRFDKFNPNAGGSYRFVNIDAKGNEYGFHGVVHEMAPNERIIQTFEFEGLPEKGHVMMETLRFERLPNNRTRIVTQSVFQSVADRDGMIMSGMERGVVDSHNRLDEVLTNMN